MKTVSMKTVVQKPRKDGKEELRREEKKLACIIHQYINILPICG